ncbi:MAG: hypothetical protein KBT02_09230 [Treponema sp.]|nr:hypothetical protein [Candidatus Treponema caballi]
MITLSKSSGKIASVLVTGNPSTGLGDLVNEFRSMTGAFRTAGHEIHKGLHGLGAASQAAGKELGRAAENGKGAGDVKALAQQNALDSFNKAKRENPDFGMSDKDINRAARKMGREEARAYWGQALKDRGYKSLHGGQSDAGLLQKGEDGRYSVADRSSGYAIAGKKYWDGEHWIDYTGSTAVKRNQEILQGRVKDQLDKIIRENSGKALTTDDFKGSKAEGRPDLPSESGREA